MLLVSLYTKLMCIYICVCVRHDNYIDKILNKYGFIIYVYTCVCVCLYTRMCVPVCMGKGVQKWLNEESRTMIFSGTSLFRKQSSDDSAKNTHSCGVHILVFFHKKVHFWRGRFCICTKYLIFFCKKHVKIMYLYFYR